MSDKSAKTKALTRESRATVAERVDRIVGMMQRNEWIRGKSAGPLAEEWGCAENTVTQLSSEASRVVAREVTDPDRVKVDVSALLMRDIHRASEVGEFGAVARIADVVTRIVGARVPERHEHAHVVAQYEALPRESKLERARAMRASWDEEVNRLEGEGK